MHDAEQQAAIATEMKKDYLDAKVLPDGSIAGLIDLVTTRAIVLGCTRDGWERRFCFKDRALADQRFAELESEDAEPVGWTARRPQRPADYAPPGASDSEGGET